MNRDIARRLAEQPEPVQAAFAEAMALTKRLLAQQRHDKNKLYALHAPEVEPKQEPLSALTVRDVCS